MDWECTGRRPRRLRMMPMPFASPQFKQFVRTTKYRTEAENFGWSFVMEHYVPDKVKAKVADAVQVRQRQCFDGWL